MEHISNEEKANEIARDMLPYNNAEYHACYNSAMKAMQWKDKERKELWRITRNHYQEWAEEQERQLIDNLREVLSAHMHGGEIDEVLAELDEKMKGE